MPAVSPFLYLSAHPAIQPSLHWHIARFTVSSVLLTLPKSVVIRLTEPPRGLFSSTRNRACSLCSVVNYIHRSAILTSSRLPELSYPTWGYTKASMASSLEHLPNSEADEHADTFSSESSNCPSPIRREDTARRG